MAACIWARTGLTSSEVQAGILKAFDRDFGQTRPISADFNARRSRGGSELPHALGKVLPIAARQIPFATVLRR